MSMSLLGISLGIAFFVVTQAQTSGFEAFFIRTILGTNGALHISDRFQDVTGMVSKAEKMDLFNLYSIREKMLVMWKVLKIPT